MTPQELKNSILQLAIQGKLVEQRPEEGSAEELYAQIQKEKQKLIKEGKIKKEKPLPEITDDEKPFDIPESWKWSRFGNLFNIVNGFTPKRDNAEYWTNGTIPWFTIDDVHEQGRNIEYTRQHITEKALSKTTDRIVPANTVLLCCTASVGEYAITRIPLTTNQQFNALVIKDLYNGYISPEYLILFVQTLKSKLITNAGKTTFNFLSVGKLSEFEIPIPPFAEQKRIVARIEELMPLVDRYEKAWTKLEAFNKQFPVDMQKSILQMAIMGNLAEQRPEEGTGEELYKQIQTEKQKLIKEGKIKKEKTLPEITDDEKPFDIPESWKWVRLQEIVSLLGDGIHGTPEYDANGEYYFINGNNLVKGSIEFKEDTKKVNETEYEKYSKNLDDNTILVSINGTIGNYAFYKNEPIILGKSACYFSLLGDVNKKYICRLINTKFFMDYVSKEATKTTIKNVSLKAMRMLPVPLPPLSEQKRIVAKIEELLPYCNMFKG